MTSGKHRKAWGFAIGILVLALIGIGLFYFFTSRDVAKGDAVEPYTIIHPTWEAIAIDISGDGYVRGKDRQTFYAQAMVTVDNVFCEEGEAIEEGEVIAVMRSDELAAQLEEASQSLAALISEAGRVSLTKHESSITAPIAGRLKWIVEEGGCLVHTIEAYGAIGYISQEKRMQVSIHATGRLSEGELLTVSTDQGPQAASVTRVGTPDGYDIVEVQSDTLRIQTVEVRSAEGIYLGKGLLLPVNGVPIQASHGTVDSLIANENDQVSRGSKLLTLQEDYTAETQNAFSQLRQAQDAYEALLAKQAALVLRAPYDCVVTVCQAEEGATLTQGTALVSIISRDAFEIVAAVDEMDIAYVEAGQKATVALDALRGEAFEATVSRISTAGKYESGVATFDVYLDLQTSTGILSGMSAQVTILAKEQTQALMVPKAAIIYQNEKPYLLTADGAKPVTLGVLDGDSVQILSGADTETRIMLSNRNEEKSSSLLGGGLQ